MSPTAQSLILAVSLAAGCDRPPPEGGASGRGDASEAAFTVRDSAGVEIVVNHAPERPRGRFWTFDREPAFVLGGKTNLGGDAPRIGPGDTVSGAIWRVVGIARLADGRIAVLSSENGQLYLFEPSGRLSKTIGRKGRGPGEFSRPQHLWYLPPDTLVVWDRWMGPITRFDTAGRVLERRSIDLGTALERLPGEASVESRTIALPDGSFLVEVVSRDADFDRPPDDTRIRYPPVEYVRLDEAYTAISLGSWEGRERWVVPERFGELSPVAGSYLAGIDYLYPTSLVSHVAAGGHPPAIYVSGGDSNEIRQFSLDGTLVRIIRRTTSPVRVTERAWRQKAWRVLSVVNGGAAWDRPLVEAMPKWDSYPPLHGMIVDSEGRLWVREWSEAETGAPDRWSVFSPQGRWLGVLDAPANPARPPDLGHCQRCWVGKDFFLTVTRDDLGIERVEAYRIRRGG